MSRNNSNTSDNGISNQKYKTFNQARYEQKRKSSKNIIDLNKEQNKIEEIKESYSLVKKN